MTVWINGALLPDSEARISVFDHGLVVGDGVFEAVKVTDGVPFALTRHLARLARSAAGMELPEPDLDEIRAGALALLEASGRPARARLRITLTAGISPLGSQRGDGPMTAIIALGSLSGVRCCPTKEISRGAPPITLALGLELWAYTQAARPNSAIPKVKKRK